MDVKPVFAVALVACCMAVSFMLKVYTNQTNVILFSTAEAPDLVNNEPKGLAEPFKDVKTVTAKSKISQQGEDLATRALTIKLYTQAQY